MSDCVGDIRIEANMPECTGEFKEYMRGVMVKTGNTYEFFQDPPDKFEQYDHGWGPVWVRSDLRGRHREFCECYECTLFHPGEDNNCQRAQALYEFDIMWDCVTPVWECPEFDNIEETP